MIPHLDSRLRTQLPCTKWIRGACFGAKYHSLRSCNFRAQNRLGLQLYPIQIARLMDTATSNSLHTGTYKLHPPLIVKISLFQGRPSFGSLSLAHYIFTSFESWSIDPELNFKRIVSWDFQPLGCAAMKRGRNFKWSKSFKCSKYWMKKISWHHPFLCVS